MRGALRLAAALVALLAALGTAPSASATAAAGAAAIGPAPPRATLELAIPLVADDAGLARLAQAVSTPGSPRYGQFEPLPALARRFGATAAAIARVTRFLREAGARSVAVSATRMYVTATMTAGGAERAFGTALEQFRTPSGTRFLAPASGRGARLAAAGALPAALRGAATGVTGLDTEPLVRPAQSQPPSAYAPRTGTPVGCAAGLGSGGFAPNQYLAAYGFDALQRAGLRGHGIRAALIEIDGFKRSDIDAFGRCFGVGVPPIHTFTVGFSRPLAPGGESTLDIELLSAAAPRLASIDVYENRGDSAAVLQAFTAPLISPGAKPQVVSASLGICEKFVQQTMGFSGIQAVERDLQLAAASGITELASAGDQGSSACVNQDGSIDPELAVSYPASSPYITGVGGTNVVLDGANHIASEIVWNDASLSPNAGGGGVSGVFDRPPYQRGVIGLNARAVPDVALLSDLAPGYAVYCTAPGDHQCSGWSAIGGTSAAAPLLAGGLALIDQDLERHHREELGFLNPLLYQVAGSAQGAHVFHDVTQYGNDLGQWLPGQGAPLGCCSAGPGYDFASGWGSVNLAALDLAVLPLRPPAPDVSLRLPRGQAPLRTGQITALVGCSARCRAYVSGNVVLSSTVGLGIRSATVTIVPRRPAHLRLVLTAPERRRIRAALDAHRHVFVELFAVAIDRGGAPLTVTAGAVLGL